MALARGRFGIEYDPHRQDNRTGLVSWAIALTLGVAFISLALAIVGRFRGSEEGLPEIVAPAAPDDVTPAEAPAHATPRAPEPEGFAEIYARLSSRPSNVRTLLSKLKEAQAQGDLKTEVATIEQLRAIPGNSALDLNNLLVNRLGELNTAWLFTHYNPKWVKSVRVKSGDSATRIAQDHGATLESLKRLNPDRDLAKLRVGDTVRVMDHPRFYLCVYPNTRKADLQLNGIFFKRYGLREAVTGAAGTFEPTGSLRKFLAEHGVWFQLADRQELEALLPKKFTFVIGDL